MKSGPYGAQEALNFMAGHNHPTGPDSPAVALTAGQGGISCSGCGARWSGVSRAHASCCHQTFSSVSLFDAHRSISGEHGSCRDPETIVNSRGERLMFFRDGMWRSPEMTAEEKAEAFGRAS